MTPEHCAAIMEHLPVIKAIAEGKKVYFSNATPEVIDGDIDSMMEE